jgi:hypothetical protein
MFKRFAVALAVLAGALAVSQQALAFQVPPVTNQAALQECTACHMIFPPQMLPARSWTKLMATLDNHFNETATLDAKVQADILNYLIANAADAPAYRQIKGLLAGVKSSDVPLRITDMPWWQRIHGTRDARWFKKPGIKSAANCAACHQGADKGYFQGD